MPKVTFDNSHKPFFQAVKGAVDSYFKTKQLKKTGNWRLYLKAWTLIPIALGVYLFLLLGQYNWWAGMLTSFFLGLTLVCIAFNVMHDACHNSFSDKKWINSVMGLTLNAMGGNAFIWKIKHNVIHHTYTNVDGIDDDIAHSPLLRQCTTQKWVPAHRFQFLYMFPLYSLSTLAWAVSGDFTKYFQKRINNTPMRSMDVKQHLVFWASKLLYAFFYIGIPIHFLGWKAWLVGFLIINVTMGLVLSMVFQLAHMVEKVSFEVADDTDKVINSEWAIHEIRTTANFAPENKIVSWFTGGLNFQVEHHLFPQISHIHYPAISKIVKQQCEAFGLPYNYYPTTRQALFSHVRLMKSLGDKHGELAF